MYAVCAHRHLDTHATGKSACCTVMAWLWSSDTDRVNKRKTVLMNSLFLVRLHVQLCLLYTPDEVLRWGGLFPLELVYSTVIIILPTGICSSYTNPCIVFLNWEEKRWMDEENV